MSEDNGCAGLVNARTLKRNECKQGLFFRRQFIRDRVRIAVKLRIDLVAGVVED